MKHLIITLLLLTHCSFSSFAQGSTKLITARVSYFIFGSEIDGDSITYFYDNLHQQNLLQEWEYDTTGNWHLIYQYTDYSYDSNGNLLSKTEQGWEEASQSWVNNQRVTNTFDANNNQLSSIVESWNGTDWEWMHTSTWTYDANNNPLTNTGTSSRVLYTYNAQNLLETETYQSLTNGNWVNYLLYEYTYMPNSSGIESKTESYWASNTSSWLKTTRTINTYDVNGDAVKNTIESWDAANSAWMASSINFNTYDAKHNLTYWLWQTFNYATGLWDDVMRQYNDYDAESNFLGARNEGWNGSSWELWGIGRNYYTVFVSTNAALKSPFEVYPNPASTTFRISGEGLANAWIFDTQGRALRSFDLSGNEEQVLETGDLPAGGYLLQVLDKTGKLGVKPFLIK